jgi:hypothetical protein
MSTALPGATYTIPADGFARLDAIVGGETEPLWAFMVAMSGLGVTIEELFAMFDCTMEDGPMLGEWAVEFEQDLEPGREYTVTSEILGVEHKQGRSMRFDVVHVRTVLEGAATCEFAYVVPRS